MPKKHVTITGLFIGLTTQLAMGAQLSVTGQQAPPMEIQKIDITSNSSDQWQPNSLQIWTSEKKPFLIHTQSGNEALAVRKLILEMGSLECEVRLGKSCASYKIHKN